MLKQIFTLGLSLCMLGAQAITYTTKTDIPYRSDASGYAAERCKVDIYHPTDTAGLPVVVWFHGGGLTKGNKKIQSKLKDSGMVVVAANYRLLPKSTIDETIDDAAAAVAWVFNNIDKYGGDPSKIFVSGHSAGGYLTSMIGLDKSRLAPYGIDPDSIRALIPLSGQAITHFAKREAEGVGSLDPRIDETAPIYHLRPDAPPYIMICGDRNIELYGRYEENAFLWRLLTLKGHPDTELYEIDGHNHSEMVTPALLIVKKTVKRILDNNKK